MSDEQATRRGIEQAFEEHLGQGIEPGDWVLFHFSGYGRRLADGQASLMTFDSGNPEGNQGNEDLTLTMLWLLLQRLPTRNGLVILDCSFDWLEGGPRHLAARCQPVALQQQSVEARAAQSALQEQLSLSPEQVSLNLRQGWPQTVVFASDAQQWAIEMAVEGECCGLFTAAWTRSLWQRPQGGVQQWWLDTGRAIARYRGSSQVPRLLTRSQTSLAWSAVDPQPGRAWVIGSPQEDGETSKPLTLWLGGIPLGTATAYGQSAQLTLPDASRPAVEVLSRQGLRAIAQGSVPLGTGLQESLRILPRQPHLLVEWDASVTKVERVDGAAALARFNWLSIAPPERCGAVRLWSSAGHYGIAGDGRWKTVQAEGAIGTALTALWPALSNRLALQQLQALLNDGPTALPLAVLLQSGDNKLLQLKSGPQPLAGLDAGPTLPHLSGDLRLRLLNPGQQGLEILVLVGDRQGEWRWLHPPALRPQGEETGPDIRPWQIVAGAEAVLPLSGTAGWPLTGYGEVWILACRTGWLQTRSTIRLQLEAQSSPNRIDLQGILPAILQDLAAASQALKGQTTPSDGYALAVSQWAGICLSVEAAAP
jgi:hypothetical protein